MEFASNDLCLQQFADATATIEFIRVIDHLSDILNSKSIFAKEYKSVLRISHDEFFRLFLVKDKDYLLQLRLGGLPMHKTPRKTTVLGFVAAIGSVLGLYDTYAREGSSSYLATYRLSQYHIELTFNVIRSRGRWNNNPTVFQFRAAYKRLFLKHDIKPTPTGNVAAEEELHLSPSADVSFSDKHVSVVDTDDILRRYGLGRENVTHNDHTYDLTPTCLASIAVSEFVDNIVTYMTGYVASKLCMKLRCVCCQSGLLSSNSVAINCKLIQQKDNAGLLMPSESTISSMRHN